VVVVLVAVVDIEAVDVDVVEEGAERQAETIERVVEAAAVVVVVVVEGMHPRMEVEVGAGVATLALATEMGPVDTQEATVAAPAVGGEMPTDAPKYFTYESSHPSSVFLVQSPARNRKQKTYKNKKKVATRLLPFPLYRQRRGLPVPSLVDPWLIYLFSARTPDS
jgi:hypothetical protein